MEQFFFFFFNDNSVCVGLCDLKRKIDDVNFAYTAQPQYQQPTQRPAQQAQPKPQKQTLAQKFAAQQKEYAAKQAYLEEQRRKYALMQQQVQQMERQAALRQQAAQQKVVQQKPVYKAAQQVNASPNMYMRNTQKQAAPKQTVIVNGSMKKVVSAAVPARY